MPEEAEDMWHTYNLLQVRDSLRASTIRWGRLFFSSKSSINLSIHKKRKKCYINKFRYHPNPRSVFILYIPFYPRKVQTESTTGSVGSSRVRTTLTLCVEAIDFDSQACQLRVKGTNLEENQYVKVCHVEDRKQSGRIFFIGGVLLYDLLLTTSLSCPLLFSWEHTTLLNLNLTGSLR